MRGGVAKKWTTEVCGRSRSSGPVTSNDFGDQRLLRRILCCFNRRSMGSDFFGRAGPPGAGGLVRVHHQHQWYHRVYFHALLCIVSYSFCLVYCTS